MSTPIKAADIEKYLNDRNDFDLELFAYRSLLERGWSAELGGSYPDPLQQKFRQFDVRAHKEFNQRTRINILRELMLAVECKSLTPEYPLILSRVARSADESSHDVIKRWHRQEINDTAVAVVSSAMERPSLYGGGLVGKATTQIKWNDDKEKRLIASDAESYEKWAQALASAIGLLDMTADRRVEGADPVFTFVMPILLVNDGTLWVVDYDDRGQRATPVTTEEATLWVGREHEIHNRYGTIPYRLGHLHIYTRTGFLRLLDGLVSPIGSMLEKIFGAALRDFAA